MKRIITIILSVSMLCGCIMAVQATTAVDYLVEKGILEGFDDGDLHLERTLTRAEFAKMFDMAFLKYTHEVRFEFSDIDESFWGYENIQRAANAGVINGFDDGSFRPNDLILYEQALKMVCTYLEGSYLDYPEGHVGKAIEMGFTDGIKANMGEALTRTDAASLLYNVMKYEENNQTEKADMKLYSSAVSGGSGGGGSAAMTYATAESAIMDIGVEFNTEEYTANEENIFKNALTSPLSTFSIDTDTASYSNMRRFIVNGQMPENGSIRSEELINYFDYTVPQPEGDEPVAISVEAAVCPWNTENILAKIDVAGAEPEVLMPNNLTFLIDVSGSMMAVNKLPLIKKSMKILLDGLNETDTVSLVTYASGTQVVLESTPVSQKEKIINAIEGLQAGGGTSGADGLTLAYEQAQKSLTDGNNRIILCTDGDFNIGPSSTGELEELIKSKRDMEIYITVLGFGMGNYKDNRMETLADKGNGSYMYIDGIKEANKVFNHELTKTLYTVAKDVKIQVEFNPATVKEYRLVGYENRKLDNEDFENDKKDAGELGAGGNVTAFYEIVPANGENAVNLKYQNITVGDSEDLMSVKVRYKDPDGEESKLIEVPALTKITQTPSADFKFAAAVAQLGMILNKSEYKGTADYDSTIALAKEGIGEDEFGIKNEFVLLVDLLKYIDN